MKAQASIGSSEYPQEIPVEILGPSDVPLFYRCVDADGRKLIIHRNKIKAAPSNANSEISNLKSK